MNIRLEETKWIRSGDSYLTQPYDLDFHKTTDTKLNLWLKKFLILISKLMNRHNLHLFSRMWGYAEI